MSNVLIASFLRFSFWKNMQRPHGRREPQSSYTLAVKYRLFNKNDITTQLWLCHRIKNSIQKLLTNKLTNNLNK